MRRILLFLILLALLTARVSATDDLTVDAEGLGVDTEVLAEGLNDEAAEALADISPEGDIDFWGKVKDLFFSALSKVDGSFHDGLKLCAILIAIVTLCAVVQMLGIGNLQTSVIVVGALGITAAVLGTFTSMLRLAESTVQELTDYCGFLLPVLASTTALSGSMTASTALYAGTVFFSQLLMRLICKILLPCVYFYLAVATAEAALSESALTELRELIGWLISKSLRILLYVFLAYMTATGVISGSADASALKATKAAVSGMVPVVGGILSDASETILAGAAILKNSVGVFGMLAVLATCLLPFLKVGVHYLLLKLTAAVSGSVACKEHTGLLKNCSTAMGYLLAMCGTCSLLLLISGVCFLKVAV